MKILQHISFIGLFLCIYGCDPVPFDTTDDTPVFSIDMTIDGEEYLFEAGNNDYFLQTEIIEIGPTKYFGTFLRRIDGQLIDNELAMTISFQIGEEVHNSDNADDINSFKTGLVPYSTFDNALLPLAEVVFEGDYNGSGSDVAYEWEYGDGITSDYKDPVHAYRELDIYTASLKVLDDNQCSARASNTVRFDTTANCIANVNITGISSNTAVLESSSNGTAPFEYVWSNGTTDKDIAIDINDSNDVQEHCVTITDANGCSSVNCIGIKRDDTGTINTCIAMMDESIYTNARRAKQFNSVWVNWVLLNSKEYSSREVLQPSDSYFRIISFEEYDKNAQGNRTVKVDFEFSCWLYLTGGTDPVKVENATGSIAVAIP